MRKKKPGCFIVLGVFIGLSLLPTDTRYSFSDNYEIVTHGPDMYILINAYDTGTKGPWIFVWFAPARAHHFLFHVRNEQVTYNDIPWGKNICEINAYNGNVCLDCSQMDRTTIFVATDPYVHKVPDSDNAAIIDFLLHDRYNGLYPWDGWKKYSNYDLAATVPATLPEKQTVIMLGKDKYTFTFRRYLHGATSGESYSMSGPGFQQPEQLLYKWPTPARNSVGY